jgi:hypothetical protein
MVDMKWSLWEFIPFEELMRIAEERVRRCGEKMAEEAAAPADMPGLVVGDQADGGAGGLASAVLRAGARGANCSDATDVGSQGCWWWRTWFSSC